MLSAYRDPLYVNDRYSSSILRPVGGYRDPLYTASDRYYGYDLRPTSAIPSYYDPLVRSDYWYDRALPYRPVVTATSTAPALTTTATTTVPLATDRFARIPSDPYAYYGPAVSYAPSTTYARALPVTDVAAWPRYAYDVAPYDPIVRERMRPVWDTWRAEANTNLQETSRDNEWLKSEVQNVQRQNQQLRFDLRASVESKEADRVRVAEYSRMQAEAERRRIELSVGLPSQDYYENYGTATIPPPPATAAQAAYSQPVLSTTNEYL